MFSYVIGQSLCLEWSGFYWFYRSWVLDDAGIYSHFPCFDVEVYSCHRRCRNLSGFRQSLSYASTSMTHSNRERVLDKARYTSGLIAGLSASRLLLRRCIGVSFSNTVWSAWWVLCRNMRILFGRSVQPQLSQTLWCFVRGLSFIARIVQKVFFVLLRLLHLVSVLLRFPRDPCKCSKLHD